MYTSENRKADFQFFLDEYDNLYKKYGHKFFAIQNQQILGVFDTQDEALQSISQTNEMGTFIVQECNGDESGYTSYISSWQLV